MLISVFLGCLWRFRKLAYGFDTHGYGDRQSSIVAPEMIVPANQIRRLVAKVNPDVPLVGNNILGIAPKINFWPG